MAARLTVTGRRALLTSVTVIKHRRVQACPPFKVPGGVSPADPGGDWGALAVTDAPRRPGMPGVAEIDDERHGRWTDSG